MPCCPFTVRRQTQRPGWDGGLAAHALARSFHTARCQRLPMQFNYIYVVRCRTVPPRARAARPTHRLARSFVQHSPVKSPPNSKPHPAQPTPNPTWQGRRYSTSCTSTEYPSPSYPVPRTFITNRPVRAAPCYRSPDRIWRMSAIRGRKRRDAAGDGDACCAVLYCRRVLGLRDSSCSVGVRTPPDPSLACHASLSTVMLPRPPLLILMSAFGACAGMSTGARSLVNGTYSRWETCTADRVREPNP